MATLVKPATRVAAQCTNALALAGATTVRPIRSKHRRMTLGWEFISGMNLLGQRIGKGGDMKIIPMEDRKKCRCYFCGETRSVKYLIKISDPVMDSKPCEVACCNKCAALRIGREE